MFMYNITNNIILDCHFACLKRTEDKVHKKKSLTMSINNAASFFVLNTNNEWSSTHL